MKPQDETDLDATGIRKALVRESVASGYESAEAVYRSVQWLRDLLPADAQKQLAVAFEWAREGISQQTADEVSAELIALHASYGYARDVMLDEARKGPKK